MSILSNLEPNAQMSVPAKVAQREGTLGYYFGSSQNYVFREIELRQRVGVTLKSTMPASMNDKGNRSVDRENWFM